LWTLQQKQGKNSQQPPFSSERKASLKPADADTWVFTPKVPFHLRPSEAQNKLMHGSYLLFSPKASSQLISKC